MKEITGNLWDLPADIICITTNGTIKANGRGVMGRGCAKEALTKFPTIDKCLGDSLKSRGNHVQWIYGSNTTSSKVIFAFPVKHNWWEEADLELIKRSAMELMKILNTTGIKSVLLPRPGCGNGKLKWEDVKPVIEPILDDRVTIVTWR